MQFVISASEVVRGPRITFSWVYANRLLISDSTTILFPIKFAYWVVWFEIFKHHSVNMCIKQEKHKNWNCNESLIAHNRNSKSIHQVRHLVLLLPSWYRLQACCRSTQIPRYFHDTGKDRSNNDRRLDLPNDSEEKLHRKHFKIILKKVDIQT